MNQHLVLPVVALFTANVTAAPLDPAVICTSSPPVFLATGNPFYDTTALTVTNANGTLIDVGGVAVACYSDVTLAPGVEISARGSRPFALLSTSGMVINGSLDSSAFGPTPGAGGFAGGDNGGASPAEAGFGPGGGEASTTGGGGGGYGGAGGDGANGSNDAEGGMAYGDLFATLQGGSGGGQGALFGATNGIGGGGGGSIEIGATDVIDLGVNTQILALGGIGGDATAPSDLGGGGGSGGAILIHGSEVNIPGVGTLLDVSGGNGGAGDFAGGGGGGGGRIVIQNLNVNQNNGQISAGSGMGGAAPNVGLDGQNGDIQTSTVPVELMEFGID